MTKYIFRVFVTVELLLVYNLVPAQNVGIGTLSPNASAQLDISSTSKGLLIPRLATLQRSAIAAPANGLMVYDTGLSAFWFYNGSAWLAVGGAGAGHWTANGNNIYNNNSGNVGIGTNTPQYKMDIAGGIHSTGTSIFEGFVSVGGGSFPNYKLQVNDGSVALYNTADAKSWAMSYNSIGNYLYFQESGSTRLVIANGGNVGIGTTNPAYALDVAGAIRASGNIQSQGSLSITNNATINGGGGVAYNPNSGTNLKITPFTTANFHAVLGPFASAETTIGLPSGFSGTPSVFVGSINGTGGTAGELNRVILVLWGCDNNSCNAKIINTDNVSVDYNITWRCMAVGN